MQGQDGATPFPVMPPGASAAGWALALLSRGGSQGFGGGVSSPPPPQLLPALLLGYLGPQPLISPPQTSPPAAAPGDAAAFSRRTPFWVKKGQIRDYRPVGCLLWLAPFLQGTGPQHHGDIQQSPRGGPMAWGGSPTPPYSTGSPPHSLCPPTTLAKDGSRCGAGAVAPCSGAGGDRFGDSGTPGGGAAGPSTGGWSRRGGPTCAASARGWRF